MAVSSGIRFDLLILDYGGVYSFGYGLDSFGIIMQKTFGKVPDANERKEIKTCSRELAAGRISSHQYVLDVAHILDVQNPSVESFENNTISSTCDPSSEMIELVTQVKNSGIHVSLLSDMYMFEVATTRPWGRYDNFDYVAFSAENQLTKNDSEFFLRSINHFSVSPDRTLFVDDVAKNTHVAERLGIRTIHADKEHFAHAGALADSIREKLHLKLRTSYSQSSA